MMRALVNWWWDTWVDQRWGARLLTILGLLIFVGMVVLAVSLVMDPSASHVPSACRRGEC